jgi:hypothetical protein
MVYHSSGIKVLETVGYIPEVELNSQLGGM